MQKIFILLVIIMSSFMVGCQSDETTTIENENLDKVINEIDNDENINNENQDYFIEITASDFKNKVNSNEKNIFFIGRDTCPACKTFKPIAIEFSSTEKTNIYYVNTTNFDIDDWNIIDEIVTVEYIPTIVISDNSQILYNEHGVKSYDVLKSIVKKYLK